MNKKIVWTIAGSDSGGGAGIQADMAAMRAFHVHPCSVITALTAQNSVAVYAIAATSQTMLRQQLHALASDLPPEAIKIGMLATAEQVQCVAEFIHEFANQVPIVLDPVAISSSGSTLADDSTLRAIRTFLVPQCHLITPNIKELAALTGIAVNCDETARRAASYLLKLGAERVLVKGGHASWQGDVCRDDFFSTTLEFSIEQPRQATPHVHGTGCALSSAIAAAIADGALCEDAVIEANAYIAQGLAASEGYGAGPGPVAHTQTPVAVDFFPKLTVRSPQLDCQHEFVATDRQLGLYPVVSSTNLLTDLLEAGVKTVQLRLKNAADQAAITDEIAYAVQIGRAYGARVFINDYWQLAIRFGAYGVHLGQEDLAQADLNAIAQAGLRLGVSTHGYFELLLAIQLRPSYIALGHVFATPTKVMKSSPQGLRRLKHYAELAAEFPTVAIGGISLHNAADVWRCGVGSIAVVRAITEADDLHAQLKRFADVIEC